MKVEIKGNNLVITIPLDKAGRPSKSGKTLVHASTHGNVKAGIDVDGRPLTIGLNAYTPAVPVAA